MLAGRRRCLNHLRKYAAKVSGERPAGKQAQPVAQPRASLNGIRNYPKTKRATRSSLSNPLCSRLSPCATGLFLSKIFPILGRKKKRTKEKCLINKAPTLAQ